MRLHSKRRLSRTLVMLAAAAGLLFLLPATAVAADVDEAPAAERLADIDITGAVERNILTDPSVPFDDIDVMTRQGIVTLSGEVGDLLARDRAIEIAESIKGVRSVVSRIDVKAVIRPDAAIARDVEAAMLMDPAADSYEIDVSVDQGVVTLAGETDSWQERSFAATLARGVRGVREVKNDIDVDYRLARSDAEVAADIEKRIALDVRLDDHLIDVGVENGRVTLTGWVGSAAERRLAGSLAWVAGTHEVDSDGLDVRWWAENDTRTSDVMVRSDAAISEAVSDAFLYDPRVLSVEPEVSVENGEVTLRGVVENAQARRAAEQDAQNTTGVWRVVNLLKVRPVETPPDTDLVENVRAAIARDPHLHRHPITVVSRDGHITLEGRVDYTYQKQRAEHVASALTGVAGVDNDLRVVDDWSWKGDREIRRSIEDELFWSPFVDEDSVTVLVEDGVATLEGSVDDWPEAVAAIENAREGGADRVRSRLEIESMDSL